MPDSRTEDHRPGPERSVSYGYQFGDIHDAVVNDETRDTGFYNGISNTNKVGYICEAIGMKREYFNLDLPLPFEDWEQSQDASRAQAGLYMANMRLDFFDKLFETHPDMKRGEAWMHHTQAEYWAQKFNAVVHRRSSGILIGDVRVLH